MKKPIPNYPGYFATEDGHIVGKRKARLKACTTYDGYSVVSLSIQGRKKSIKLHKLVVQAFIGDVPAGMQVNHKNGVKSDNRISNLEIVTPSQNAQHSFYVLRNRQCLANLPNLEK